MENVRQDKGSENRLADVLIVMRGSVTLFCPPGPVVSFKAFVVYCYYHINHHH